MAIATCVCPNMFQDAKYGHGRRVANVTHPAQGTGLRCTACGKDIVKAAATKKKKQEAEPAKKKKKGR